jgi:hypothetical protein
MKSRGCTRCAPVPIHTSKHPNPTTRCGAPPYANSRVPRGPRHSTRRPPPRSDGSAGGGLRSHPESAADGTESGVNRPYLARSRAHFPPALPGAFTRCYARSTVIIFERREDGYGRGGSPAARGASKRRTVVRHGYAAARVRHAAARAEAYEAARDEAILEGVCGPDLRIADIDQHAMETWQNTWSSVHPSGAGRWNWQALVEQLPRRPAVLPVAIWYGNDLCGLALGYASKRRAGGVRHTISLTFVERRPAPPPVPLRRRIVFLAITVARAYGLSVGARRLRLRNPDLNLLWFYQLLGFVVVWKGGRAVYCEQEI